MEEPLPIRVAVVVPNYNGAAHLRECLSALDRQTFDGFGVVLVDNGSTDASLSLVRDEFPNVTIVPLDANRGFSAAVNAGIVATTGEYVVLLNNDTSADEHWLGELVRVMDAVPAAGFGASRLVRYDDPTLIDAAGDTYIPGKFSGSVIGSGRPASDFDEPGWVFGASAAAAIYRRSMLDDIGLFDEDFFLTHEDTDLAMRAQLAGYRCAYAPRAVVRHKRRVTYRLTAPWLQAIDIRNRIWVVGKNVPWPLLTWWVARALPHTFAKIATKLFASRKDAPAEPSEPAAGWSRDFVRKELAPEVRRALRALPAKRRAVRHLRRVGTKPLTTVIRHPHLPLTGERLFRDP